MTVAIPPSTVSSPAPAGVYRTIGGNLFQIALDELGDAEQWDRIASLNGLYDPWLVPGQLYALNMPAPDPNAAEPVLS